MKKGNTMRLDVSAALKQKNPKLHKWLPSFIIKWIERTIHQDEMNRYCDEHEGESSIDFAKNILTFFEVSIKINKEENIPKTGRYIIASNHPLGGLDGIALIATLGAYRQDLKFPVNDLLMYFNQMKEVFVPINKHGKSSYDAVKQLNDVFLSDELIFYFPAGLCSRKQNGEICDPEWKKTVISKAKQYQRDIIPVFFKGENSARFYRLANFRKKIGLSFNIEMLYLPDEMFRQKGKTFEITFGEPVSYKSFDKSKSDREWAAWLKDKTYSLK